MISQGETAKINGWVGRLKHGDPRALDAQPG